jgi:hypothetical protein
MRDPVETYMNLVPMVVEQTNRGEADRVRDSLGSPSVTIVAVSPS